jgi:hypothetical protein
LANDHHHVDLRCVSGTTLDLGTKSSDVTICRTWTQRNESQVALGLRESKASPISSRCRSADNSNQTFPLPTLQQNFARQDELGRTP